MGGKPVACRNSRGRGGQERSYPLQLYLRIRDREERVGTSWPLARLRMIHTPCGRVAYKSGYADYGEATLNFACLSVLHAVCGASLQFGRRSPH